MGLTVFESQIIQIVTQMNVKSLPWSVLWREVFILGRCERGLTVMCWMMDD